METTINEANRKNRREQAVTLYTSVISALGMGVVFFALMNPLTDRSGLVFFAALAILAELMSVELYLSSLNSSVSVGSILTTAAIVVLGPTAGVLLNLFGGLATLLNSLFRPTGEGKTRAALLRRWLFNTGMFAISSGAAGVMFLLLGGQPGSVARWGTLPALLGAAATETVVNLALLIGVIALQSGRSPFEILKTDFQWSVPISISSNLLLGGSLALSYASTGILGGLSLTIPILATGYSFRLYIKNTRGYVEQLEGLNQELKAANARLDSLNLELETANSELLETLGAVIDAYDVFTRGHSLQVARYAADLAQKLALSEEETERIVRAALVHDIGKVGITDAIIGKEGPLSKEEYNLVKRHPVIGAEIVSCMTGLHDLVPLVRHHHERWDGSGYPDGLRGEEIEVGARVLALADALDVICSDRPYRVTASFRQVREEMARCSGTQFEPRVVKAFLQLADERGSEYFKNTALTVERKIEVRGVKRFLKRSMRAE